MNCIPPTLGAHYRAGSGGPALGSALNDEGRHARRAEGGLQALRTVLAESQENGSRLYWLLDQSALPKQGWLGHHVCNSDWMDLLSGSLEIRLNGASPILVDTGNWELKRKLRFTDELYRVGRFSNAVSLVRSEHSLARLQHLMQHRTRIELPGSLEALLRFFDTRTLPLLPRMLTSAQYAIFTSPVERWLYLDRWGLVQRMPKPVSDLAPQHLSGPKRLCLDDPQESMLIDDGLTDSIIDFILLNQHPALDDRTPPEQFELIDPLVAAAQTAGLSEYGEAIAFVGRALIEGADFAAREPWRSRLSDYRLRRCSIEEALG